MFRMGPVHPRDKNPGVSDAEPECNTRYRDLLYTRTGIGYRGSHRNRPRACAYLAGINRRSRGASTPHRIPNDCSVICNTPFPEYVLSCVFRFSDRIFSICFLYLFCFINSLYDCFVLDLDSWTRSQSQSEPGTRL